MARYRAFRLKIKPEKEMQDAIVFAKTRRDVIRGLRYAREIPFMQIDDTSVDKVIEIKVPEAKELMRTNEAGYVELPSKRVKLRKVM